MTKFKLKYNIGGVTSSDTSDFFHFRINLYLLCIYSKFNRNSYYFDLFNSFSSYIKCLLCLLAIIKIN